METRTRDGTASRNEGTKTVPGTWLGNLAREMKPTRGEWRVVATVLAHEPVSAAQVARWLRLEYTHVKRSVRELVRWNILRPGPDGLRFQPNPDFWRPAPASRVSRNCQPPPSKKLRNKAAESGEEEAISTMSPPSHQPRRAPSSGPSEEQRSTAAIPLESSEVVLKWP
jgi:hypothetical protein